MDIVSVTPNVSPVFLSDANGSGVPVPQTDRDGMTILRTSMTILVLILGFLALLLNFSFLFVIAKQPSLRRTPLVVYLVDLSCIDIVTAIMYNTLIAIKICRSTGAVQFTSSSAVTKLASFVILTRNALHILSCLVMICISWERYKAVCRPIQTNASQPKIWRLALETATWTVALFVVLDVTIGFSLMFEPPLYVGGRTNDCNVDACDQRGTRLCLDRVPLINYLLLLMDGITTLTSFAMFRSIIRGLEVPNLGEEAQQIHRKEQRLLTKMAMVNNAAFIVFVFIQDINFCLVGWWFSSSEGLQCEFEIVYFLQGTWNLVNSAANPVIYNIFGSQFRKGFRDSFRCVACNRFG